MSGNRKPRDRNGRFRRPTPSFRTGPRILKKYGKRQTGSRLVVEIPPLRIHKKPTVPVVHAWEELSDTDEQVEDRGENGNRNAEKDGLEHEGENKRRKINQINNMPYSQTSEQPNDSHVKLFTHPSRKRTHKVRRVLPHHRTQVEGARERSQSIGTALREGLAKERGCIRQPNWKPRSGIIPSTHLLKMLKTRRNMESDPQTYTRPTIENERTTAQKLLNEISQRAQNSSGGMEQSNVVSIAESRMGNGVTVVRGRTSPPLFCSNTPMPEMSSEKTIVKSPSPENPTSAIDRSESTPPPVFRFLSPVPTEASSPTPSCRPDPQRRRNLPFRQAFLVPSVEARDTPMISETPFPEAQRVVQSVQGQSVLFQGKGTPQVQYNLTKDTQEVASRCVTPLEKPSEEFQLQSFRDFRGNSTCSRSTVSEVESEMPWGFPVTRSPQVPELARPLGILLADHTSTPPSPSLSVNVSPVPSSPILPVNRPRSRSILSIPESSSSEEDSTPSTPDSSSSDEDSAPSTPDLTSDDSISSPTSSPIHDNHHTPALSPQSFSSYTYSLLVSKISTTGTQSTTRTINVPSTYTFEQLHRGLLSAFCLPPNLRYNFGLLKLSPPDKERGFGFAKPYPRERLLLAGDKKKGFERHWRADSFQVSQLMGELEEDGELDLWWCHEGASAWTHRIERVGMGKGSQGWYFGVSGMHRIGF
ncbi:hypothetical protein HYFRA_00011090 [Hymenoscyphus fraxineus]|uniref:Uncharacterized protein n=1 Tax=Hymenoscyphus fraxineus TaxID=746836 RepID=A0A9N9L5B2_9HELO|nr:hypothetical protein HYFRA_00011090 [Hymenoscyphus fraxineus]